MSSNCSPRERKRLMTKANVIAMANNHAAKLIECGHYGQAMIHLTTAMRQSKCLFQNKEQRNLDSAETSHLDEPVIDESNTLADDEEATATARRIRNDRPYQDQPNSPCCNHDDESFSNLRKHQWEGSNCGKDDSEDDLPFIYDRPSFVDESLSNSDDYFFTIQMSLIFNLAVANHMTAFSMSSFQKKRMQLKRALKLYELVYLLQMNASTGLNLSQTMALANNCAQIHLELNQENRANRLLQHLASSLMLVVDSGESNDVEGLDGFLLTTTKLILIGSSRAAAAA